MSSSFYKFFARNGLSKQRYISNIGKFSHQIDLHTKRIWLKSLKSVLLSSRRWLPYKKRKWLSDARVRFSFSRILYSANHLRSAKSKGPLWNCRFATLPNDDNEITSVAIIKEYWRDTSVNYRLCSSVPFIFASIVYFVGSPFKFFADDRETWIKGWWRFRIITALFSHILLAVIICQSTVFSLSPHSSYSHYTKNYADVN